jgi:hypothetical protein
MSQVTQDAAGTNGHSTRLNASSQTLPKHEERQYLSMIRDIMERGQVRVSRRS